MKIDVERLQKKMSERGEFVMQMAMMEAIRLELRAIRAQRNDNLTAPDPSVADALAAWALGQD